MCSLKCQNGTAEITSLNAVDKTRKVETILRNTSRYSHNSLGHWESEGEHYIVKTDEQRSFFKLLSKDDYGEVGRFLELSWFHSTDKQTKLAE